MFYKYRGNSEFTDQIFTSGNVYLSTAAGLNDPFECSLQEIAGEWIENKVNELKVSGVAGFLATAEAAYMAGESLYSLSNAEVSRVLEQFRELGTDDAYELYKDTMLRATGHLPSDCENLFNNLNDQLQQVGIFSLSSCAENALLWAHYGEEHRGICIGFDTFENCKLQKAEHCLAVNYSADVPAMDGNGFNVEMAISLDEYGRPYTSAYKIGFADKTFQAAITTKSPCWSYEKEFRYIEPTAGEFPWPGIIAEVTFGLRCEEKNREHYIKLLTDNVPNTVLLFEMVKIKNSSALKRIPYKTAKTIPKLSISPNDLCEDGDKLIRKMSAAQFEHRMDALISTQQYSEAIEQIEFNLKTSENAPRLLHLKGVALGLDGQHLAALTTFEQLIEQYPDIPHSWYQKGCALLALGKYENALEAFQVASSMGMVDASLELNIGIIIAHLGGQEKDAKTHLNNAKLLGHPKAAAILDEL